MTLHFRSHNEADSAAQESIDRTMACQALLERLRRYHHDRAKPDIAPELGRCAKTAPAPELQPEPASEPQPAERVITINEVGDDAQRAPTMLRPELRPHPVTTIISAASKHFRQPTDLILSHRRQATLIRARHVAVYLAVELTSLSMPQLGTRFGDRDHTTILHAHKTIKARLPSDADLAADIAAVRALAVKADPRFEVQEG